MSYEEHSPDSILESAKRYVTVDLEWLFCRQLFYAVLIRNHVFNYWTYYGPYGNLQEAEKVIVIQSKIVWQKCVSPDLGLRILFF